MKTLLNHIRFLLALCLTAVAPLTAPAQTTFFTDTFVNGSTTNGPSVPGGTPTASFTSYDIASTKNATFSTIAPGDFTLRLNASTTAGWVESQALFTTNPVALSTVGDYIDISVVFTNTPQTNANSANVPVSSLMVGTTSPIYVGLYDSGGGNLPVAGGLANAGLGGTATFLTGNCANWKGYVSQITSNGTSRIITRPLQASATTSAAQDLVAGSGNTGGYSGPAGTVIATTPVAPVPLVSGGQYTLYLRITLMPGNSLSFSNSIYSGSGLSGPIIYFQTNAIATNATFLTANFDGFAIGAFNKSPSGGPAINPTMDITSVTITGQATAITTPPTITSQPVSATVATNGACMFSVSATGFGMQYQWHRNGANLNAGGNISLITSPDATTSMLVISSAGPADELSGANGYYVTVTGTGGYFTNSVTNSLTLVPATNLIWSGNLPTWDLNNTADWLDPFSNLVPFNFGDPVTFDDTGAGGQVTLTGPYLSAASVTVDGTFTYNFSSGSSGSFAGPGNLIYKGSGQLTLGNVNTYSGGTIISNASAHLLLQNYNGLGTGPVTLAKAGGLMEITSSGSAANGINGDIIVADDFTIRFNGLGTFSGVLFGDLSGTTGKVLTFNPNPSNTTTNQRIRVLGTNTVYNANLLLNSSLITLANYEPSGHQTYNGVISGPGSLIQRGNGLTILNGANTYSGGTTPTTGTIGFGLDTVGSVTSGPIGTGPLLLAPEVPNLTGSGAVLAYGGARTIANPIQYPSYTNNLTLIVGGTNNLTFSGPFTLNGNDAPGTPTNRFLQVTNTGLTTISGVISDGALGFGLVKTGNGILALNNTETYTGPTAVSNGTLWVNGQLNVASAVTVATNGILGGTGTNNGPVTVNGGGTLAPGAAAIGTLTVNNSLTFAGTGGIRVRVNRSGSQADKAVVSGTLSNVGTGIVTVTNLGTTLQIGDTFTLFNTSVTGGGALTVTGGGVTWNNNLASGGTISVAAIISFKPVITNTIVSGGTNLIFSGTNATGTAGGTYYVRSATNVNTPLVSWTFSSTNIFGPGGAFSVTNTVVPGEPRRFYLLSLP